MCIRDRPGTDYASLTSHPNQKLAEEGWKFWSGVEFHFIQSSFGSVSYTHLRQMMSADNTRTAFANNLKSVLKEYEFDGVDLDIFQGFQVLT